MQAVITKFISPTNYKPARISVNAGNGHRTILSWPDRLNVPDAHLWAARAFCNTLGWGAYVFAQGETPDGTGYAFVRLAPPTKIG